MTFDRTTFASEPRAVVSILAVAFYLMLALVLPTNTTYYAKTSKYCCLSQEWQVKRLLSATRVYHHSLGHCHVLVWSDLRSRMTLWCLNSFEMVLKCIFMLSFRLPSCYNHQWSNLRGGIFWCSTPGTSASQYVKAIWR